jgi:hypothetical protein
LEPRICEISTDVVEVVLDQVPDDPRPGDDPDLAVASAPRELHLEVLGRPSVEGLLEQRPRPLEGVGELGRRAWMALVVLPTRVLEREVRHGGLFDAEHVPDGGVALAEDVGEPVRARARHVARELPDRPLERRRPRGELLGVQRPDRVEEQSLVPSQPWTNGSRIWAASVMTRASFAQVGC